MINEFLQVASALENTNTKVPTSTHPLIRPINKGTVIGKIDKKGNLVSIEKITNENMLLLYKIQEISDGRYAGTTFPAIRFCPSDKTEPDEVIGKGKVNTKIIINKRVIADLLPRLVEKFKKYPELKNFVCLCKVVITHFDFKQFATQYAKLVKDCDLNEDVNIYLDFDNLKDGYYVSNTSTWDFIKTIMYNEYPIEDIKGNCWFGGTGPVVEPKGMEVFCSKRLFSFGLCLYNKNVGACSFSNDSKLQISRKIYDKVRDSAEWILSDKRLKKNSYAIEPGETVMVCYNHSNPATNDAWAEMLCETPPDGQDNAEPEIQSIWRNIIITGKNPPIIQSDLSYFIIRKVNDSTFVIDGEGTISINKLINALKKWNFCSIPIFKESKKLNTSIGLLSVYRLLNKHCNTINFTDLFNKVFVESDKEICRHLLETIFNRYWKSVVDTVATIHTSTGFQQKSKPKKDELNIFTVNDILLTTRIMNEKIKDTSDINMECIGQYCNIADALNKQYIKLQIKGGDTISMLCGYEMVRDIDHGDLIFPMGKLMAKLPKYINWAMQYNREEAGLVKYFLNHLIKLSVQVEGVRNQFTQQNRRLTINEKTQILLAYVAGIKKEMPTPSVVVDEVKV